MKSLACPTCGRDTDGARFGVDAEPSFLGDATVRVIAPPIRLTPCEHLLPDTHVIKRDPFGFSIEKRP